MATDALEPNDILSRLEIPMTPAAAEAVLLWKFNPQAIDRMNELAEKARSSELSPAEAADVETFERYNNVLGILKSRARQLLNKSSETTAS